ncbi:hypothetical protein [Micrococcus sp. H39-S4]|uniref:hypothetical protein n=1 Tax=Micrococcus sp. H39-S4 TaxID=3004356 RepID=UPI0022B009CC|nr:hypothetical protein [Micrococcus sp. H39-S4]MCZ4071216.1 hypothetical protein [Micrococcus sp. H39-S4]
MGLALMEQGSDPRIGGWDGPNTMWALANLGRPGQDTIAHEVAEADVFPAGPEGTTRNVRAATRVALSYLYPDRIDLVAFRTVLQLATGAAPEEWTGVTLADIDVEHEVVRVRLRKTRAHQWRTLVCPVTTDQPGTGWRSGDILLRLLNATALVRHELSDHGASPLFATVLRNPTGNLCARPVKFNQQEFSELLGAIESPISRPHDSRRLRKTVKSVRAALLRSIDIAADDNTVPVFHRHYAQSTTIHVLAGEAVTAAQTQVLDRLHAGPTVITAPSHELTGAADPQIAAAATAETAASPADRAMGPATCADPYASPYSVAGRLCEHRPSMCFACPNAIVFTDHLPRLLAYREILEGQRRELAPQHFASSHGQQLLNLEAVLSQFTPEQIERAEGELTDASTAIHVPMSERGTHL